MQLPALNESSKLRYFTFFYLYVMQGIPAGFALTAMANYLAGKGLKPNEIGTFVAITGVPWVLQFIWGPLIDRYQYSVIGHRKHWVVLTQLMACTASLTLLFVKDPVSQLTLMSLVFFTHSVFASIQDASADAIAIFIVPPEQRGRVNAFMRGGFLLGISFGAAVLSIVLHNYGFRTAALIQFCCLLFFTVLTFFIKLDRNDPLLPSFTNKKKRVMINEQNPSVKWLFKELYHGITEKQSLHTFLRLALIYLCSSIFIRSYTYHIIHVLKWPDSNVSVLQGGWGSILTFGVIIGGGIISDRMGYRKLQVRVLWGIGIFLLLLNSSYSLWHYKALSASGLVLWNFADPLLSVTAFPILMSLCRQQIEGSQFTTYMALINFCDVLGSYLTGWALNIISAPTLGFTCGLVVIGTVIMMRKNQVAPIEYHAMSPQRDGKT